MPRPGVSYLDVAKAATQLVEQNLRPSIEEVRKILGTGSNSTINRHLRDWKAKQGNQVELEQGLPDSLLIAVKGIYDAIKDEASNNIKKLQEDHENAMSLMNKEISEIKQKNVILAQENDSLKANINTLEESNKESQSLTENTKQSLEKMKSESLLLEEKLSSKFSEIKTLTQQLANSQNNLDHYREVIRSERKSERHKLESRISSLEKELKDERSMNSELKSNISSLSAKNKMISDDHGAVQSKLVQETKKFHEHELVSQKYKLQLDSTLKNLDSLKLENQKLKDCSKYDRNTISDHQVKIGKHMERISLLENQLKKYEDKDVMLRNDLLFLTQEKAELALQLKHMQAQA